MRISDWSSDVCSSDLLVPAGRPHRSHDRSAGGFLGGGVTSVSAKKPSAEEPLPSFTGRGSSVSALLLPDDLRAQDEAPVHDVGLALLRLDLRLPGADDRITLGVPGLHAPGTPRVIRSPCRRGGETDGKGT